MTSLLIVLLALKHLGEALLFTLAVLAIIWLILGGHQL